MALENVQLIQVTPSGGTVTLDMTQPQPDLIALWNNAITLLADFELTSTGTAPSGTVFTIGINQVPTYPGGIPSLNLNGFKYTVFGVDITQEMLNNPFLIKIHLADNGSITTLPIGWFEYIQTVEAVQNISGLSITDGTLPLTAIENVTSGKIIVGNASNRPTQVTVSGDVTISNAGVTTIGNTKVTNAMIATGVARTKLATGTANYVIVNDGSGNLSEASTLPPSLGGTGQNNGSATGFQKWSSGTSSVGTITDMVTLQVSFESGYTGDFKIMMPCSGTVTGIYGYATKVIAGTDNGTITAKNNAGTTMGSGTITFTASDARGTAYTVNPTTNNTFVQGDLLTFTTDKTTSGGQVQLSITYTRLP